MDMCATSFWMEPLNQRGYFNKSTVEPVLARFEAGEKLAKEVFSLVTLELWHRGFVDSPELVLA